MNELQQHRYKMENTTLQEIKTTFLLAFTWLLSVGSWMTRDTFTFAGAMIVTCFTVYHFYTSAKANKQKTKTDRAIEVQTIDEVEIQKIEKETAQIELEIAKQQLKKLTENK